MHDKEFFSEFPHGSARFSDHEERKKAGVFGQKGLQIGYVGKRPLRSDSDAPMLVLAGSGSGKGRDIFLPMLCTPSDESWVVLDTRGDLHDVSKIRLAERNTFLYCLNMIPDGGGMPRHNCNYLEVLKPDCPAVFEIAKYILGAVIIKPPGRSEPYFAGRAEDYLQCIGLADVFSNGWTSFPRIYSLINMIEADRERWDDFVDHMLGSEHEFIKRTTAELYMKQSESPKEFGSIMGEIYNALSPLKSPLVRQMLEPGFSLSELADGERPVRVHICVPGEYLSDFAPIVRGLFQAVQIEKGKRPDTPRVNLLVDESAQLKQFEGLLTAMLFSRGAGVRTIAVFQDAGQIENLYGRAGVTTFFSNAQTKLFFGVTDESTAKVISSMLGTTTVDVYDTHAQAGAQRRRRQVMKQVMFEGRDPVEASAEYAHYDEASKRARKQARALMTPDEIINMPSDKMIVMMSGKDLPPIYADRYPYYSREASRELNYRYGPHPKHPPFDQVKVHGRFKSKWVNVRDVPVPSDLRHFPQHDLGTMQVIED